MADDPTSSPDPSSNSEQSAAEPELVADAQVETQNDATEAEIEVEIAVEVDIASEPTASGSAESREATPSPEAAAPPEPSVATTLTVEALEPGSAPLVALPAAGDGEGGEWELLLQKLGHWLNQNELQNLWSQASRPVSVLAALVGLLLVLRIYSALLGALDSLPLVPGLLELAGVVWVVRYGVPKLLRTSERERLLGGLNQRWKAFRGKG